MQFAGIQAPPKQSAGRSGAGLYRYVIYGLRVSSAIPLPLPPHPDTFAGAVDCQIRLGGPIAPPADGPLIAGLHCSCPLHNGRMVTEIRRGPGGSWFWYDEIGTFHVTPDAGQIDIYPSTDHDERALGIMLVGQALTFVLHQRGYPSLHASAVTTGRGAIAFLGPPGRGKSTMAAAFLRQGATLLTDDVLPLRDIGGVVHGLPSLPLMKVWQQTVTGTLHLNEALPTLTARSEKKWLDIGERFGFADAPVPLLGVYVLDRRRPGNNGNEALAFQRLSAAEGLTALLEHTSNRAYLRPSENVPLVPLYAALLRGTPIRILSYPDGFAHQDRICEAILADAAGER